MSDPQPSELSTSEMAALLTAVQTPEAPPAALPPDLERILNLTVTLRVELGRQRCSLSELLTLGGGKLLELPRSLQQPIEVYIGEHLLAFGQVVVVGGKYGVQVVEMAPPDSVRTTVGRRIRRDAAAPRVVPDRLSEV